ncbi:GpE family phage tail protein, partial [Proteus mirabilis]|nr:GpE family phage tail protein [Proteus mirabilis]
MTEVGYARFPSELTTDELAADIAVIFHWSPADTGKMSLSELLSWRYQAAKRYGQQ